MNTKYTFSDTIYSDFHKDVYGFRPSHAEWNNWKYLSDDEKQDVWDTMIVMLRKNEERERAAERAAIQKVEAILAEYLQEFFGDRQKALRKLWDEQGLHWSYDEEFLAFRLGLPYNYFSTNS